MKSICIIPARGGSKRIPRKNIKDFFGKPIIAYSIETALKSGIFDEVMVSTDDEEIAHVARSYGASIPFFRSSESANDYATLSDVLREVLDKYAAIGKTFDFMCCILPTSPMLESDDIIKGYKKLVSSDFSTIVPVVEYSYPILRSFSIDKLGALNYNWPIYAKSRSQDLAPAYHDSGTFYWNKIDKWLKGEIRRGGIIVSEAIVQDIDTEKDWKIAELKYKILHKIT